LLPLRREVQMIFQDPFSSLDPRMMVGESVAEGMTLRHPEWDSSQREARVAELLKQVGLNPADATRYPHQFSGGQRQRIGLARALAVEPRLIVCDECTSALDVSVQAQILNLLKEIQCATSVAYLFITHDLSVVGYLADRVAVMYLGHLVEEGSAEEIFAHPAHPYTKALFAAAPRLQGREQAVPRQLSGDVPSPIHPPTGCPFHPRCPHATPQCATEFPNWRNMGKWHRVRCLD
jgi:peptide/nickel transport system ATP-binding protein